MKSTARHQPAVGQDRPFVFLNMSMTADGKIANARRTVHTFGSPQDLNHLYELRATADAILSGARTVEDTGATLGNGGERHRRARLRRGLREFPVRIVASGSGSISLQAPLWKARFSPLLLACHSGIPKARLQRLQALVDGVHKSQGNTLNIASLLRWLRREHAVERLLVEGGGEVNAAFFEAGVVDAVHLTVCPRLMGGRLSPTLAEGSGLRLCDAARLELESWVCRDDEVFLKYRARR